MNKEQRQNEIILPLLFCLQPENISDYFLFIFFRLVRTGD